MPWLRVDVNFVKIHTGGQRLKGIVPDFDTLLFCQHKRLSAYEEDRCLDWLVGGSGRKMQGTSPLPGEMSFPTKLLPVGQDTGNATRRHVFVVGPEGSSTRFWTMLMACLADKVLNHCKKPHVGREEQKKAYDLMLKAAQSEEKDVDYVHQKLALMGVMNSENFDLDDGNAKYDLEGHDCGRDMLAYAQLCPNTALAREVNASC
eukprot:g32161.t1